jgi:hypothetical protein
MGQVVAVIPRLQHVDEQSGVNCCKVRINLRSSSAYEDCKGPRVFGFRNSVHGEDDPITWAPLKDVKKRVERADTYPLSSLANCSIANLHFGREPCIEAGASLGRMYTFRL